MLGALLELTESLDQAQIQSALRRLIKNQRYYELDIEALEKGREQARQLTADPYGWGV
jgi:hypothetical protein